MLTNKQIKKEIELEKINVFGQASELKAKSWIQKELAQQEKKEQQYFDLATSLLKASHKKKIIYNRTLVQIFLHHAAEEDIPSKYKIDVEVNDDGIIVRISSTRYYGAFKASGLPSFDFHACKIMAVKLGNTIAKLEGYIRTTEGGIALPDEEHLKTYGNA